MSRCRSCNSVMEATEILWRAERRSHEDLCLKCRNALRDAYRVDVGRGTEEVDIAEYNMLYYEDFLDEE